MRKFDVVACNRIIMIKHVFRSEVLNDHCNVLLSQVLYLHASFLYQYQHRTEHGSGQFYDGSFLVIRVITPDDYVIQSSRRSQPQVVHGDKLKLCFRDHSVSWLSGDENDGPTAVAPVVNTLARPPPKPVSVQGNSSVETLPDIQPAPCNRPQFTRLADYVF